QQLLDIAVAQRETELQPNRVLDDLGREAMMTIAERSHADILTYSPPPPCFRDDAPGRPKKDEDQAIGRSRDGLSMKIRALVDALGNPLALLLTPGQTHDLVGAHALRRKGPPIC